MSYYNQKTDVVEPETEEDADDEDNKMLYQVWYDHPKGNTVEEIRAVDRQAAEDIVMNDRQEIVVTSIEQVDE